MIAPPSSKTCLEKYTLDPSHEFQSSWDPTWGKEKISQDGSLALTPRPLSLAPHASKIMLKILQARLQQYVNCELPDVQSGFRKGRGTRDQIANIHWIIEKEESFRKPSTSVLLTTPKPLTVWITINCGKVFKRWECQTTLPVSWEICMQVKKQQFEPDMEQWTGSKLGKEYLKVIYCYPAF